ncbi:MAG: PaaI family thioesterase [Bacteroidales bacterium]|nr:PaaI family thioesterase [Bacteroidales bacterium]
MTPTTTTPQLIADDVLLERAHHIFALDTYATKTNRISIDRIEMNEAQKACVHCSMPLTEAHHNARGDAMGGAIFTLADFTFAVASNLQCIAQNEPLQWVSVSSTIHFLSPGRGEKLHATSCCIKHGRSSCLYDITVVNDAGQLVARVACSGMRIH